MSLDPVPFLGVPFLRSVWFHDYEGFKDSEEERALVARLHAWSSRRDLKERSAETPFVTEFFERTWRYWGAGQRPAEDGFTAHQQYPVLGAGQGGGTGQADMALGWFGRPGVPETPQVLCEFKGIRGRLDQPQRRKGNDRSPVKQAADYLTAARRGLFGNEPIVPTWTVVTDMNEFRLYWYDRMPHQCLRFIVRREDLLQGRDLISEDTEETRFDRYLFWRVFQRDTLLSIGGPCPLLRLIAQQRFRERQIEEEFYAEYRGYRERLYRVLRTHNQGFPGTPGQLVRLTQTILDRCIFIMYCEDMGEQLGFTPQLLRDYLAQRSEDPYYDPNGREIWDGLRRLFAAMDRGGPFGPSAVFAFNGGLFRHDSRLDELILTNDVFCERSQGANQASVEGEKNLLFLAAAYNFAARADGSQSLSLYTLGRIFEQSITELEILEAEAEGRESIGKVTKRKRDGVYYTPEWVVDVIVEETLGRRLAELRAESGWEDGQKPAGERAAIDRYLGRLRTLAVLDPACGSGAFLLTAVRRLLRELDDAYVRRREIGGGEPPTPQVVLREILARNIYGVDINAASVEIAQLALWLHTARRGEPLAVLDGHICCGNSLIDSRFYDRRDLVAYSEVERERVNTFDWEKAFPDVFARGGFDVIIGNPPYVKLQNFRRVHADMAEYLQEGSWHVHPFESTRTGNFDLFLPFIERSLQLLHQDGHLGFIAPSLWTKNEYGEGLRNLVRRGQHLDRWIDFEAFQVFDEAITYTALQFYTRRPNEEIRLFQAPKGDQDLPRLHWSDPASRVPYAALDPMQPWLILPEPERRLIERLWATCPRLDDPSITSAIFQGLITSADYVYHLERVASGTYRCFPPGQGTSAFEVQIEDALMRPLVSGAEAKRYEEPGTETYILFPYERQDGKVQLIQATRLRRVYPRAWAYLNRWERELRARERGGFDDAGWYRFGRNQSLDKQDSPKLLVPRIVTDLAASFDRHGHYYLDNVDVGGVLPANEVDGSFLAAVLNGSVANWVFRRISKPFQGNFRSANKQFIAPLPVPRAEPAQRAAVTRLADQLHALTTRRRELAAQLDRRVESLPSRLRPEIWLWPDLDSIDDWAERAPSNLDAGERDRWARTERASDVSVRLASIKERLTPGSKAEAELRDGELLFLVGGVPAIERVFVIEVEADLALAQWRRVARNISITENTRAKSLTDALRRLVISPASVGAQQAVHLDREIMALTARIAALEAEQEALLADLYGLTVEERLLVKGGHGPTTLPVAQADSAGTLTADRPRRRPSPRTPPPPPPA